MATEEFFTRPAGHEALVRALLAALPAARRACRQQPVRPVAAPKPNCHDAVDSWFATHSDAQAVRGWLALEQDSVLISTES
ncbi:hypothetical protein [Burkholderia alba]|uniref:hypothetical protein n=1 Tax=Burkholderia alba TaxID=2683677 RepID=UPI002B0573CC|nr:hypothetical protein [Burkholderia alba]